MESSALEPMREILGIGLALFHVVAERLAKRAIYSNQAPLLPRQCPILPLYFNLAPVKFIGSRPLARNAVSPVDLGVVAEIICHVLV